MLIHQRFVDTALDFVPPYQSPSGEWFSRGGGDIYALTITADSRWLLTGCGEGMLRRWSLPGLVEHDRRERIGGNHYRVDGLAVTPDGRDLFCAVDDGDAVVRWQLQPTIENPQPLVVARTGRNVTGGVLAMDPRGRWLALGSGGGSLIVWDLMTSAIVQVSQPHARHIRALAVAPDGAEIVAASWDGTLSWTGIAPLTVRGQDGVWDMRSAAWLPDGSAVVSVGRQRDGGGVLTVWDRRTRTPLLVRRLIGSWPDALAVHPQVPLLVIGSEHGLIECWDTQTWQPQRVVHATTHEVTQLAWTPSGAYLVSAGWGQQNAGRLVVPNGIDLWAWCP